MMISAFVWILPQEPRHLRPEDRVGSIVGGRDPNGAGGLLAKFTQGVELGLDLLKPRADGLKQAFARPGRRHAAWGGSRAADRAVPLEAANCVLSTD